jgi:hypothetical protein
VSVLRKLVLALTALVAAVLVGVGTGDGTPVLAVPAHVYVASPQPAFDTAVASERGPPATLDAPVTYDADGHAPLGTLVRPDSSVIAMSYTYDDIRRSVRITRGSQAVERSIEDGPAQPAVAERWRVATDTEGGWFTRRLAMRDERGSLGEGRGTPRSNTAQNKQFNDAIREAQRQLGRTLSKDERSSVHREISGQNYGYHDIIDEVLGMFGGGE